MPNPFIDNREYDERARRADKALKAQIKRERAGLIPANQDRLDQAAAVEKALEKYVQARVDFTLDGKTALAYGNVQFWRGEFVAAFNAYQQACLIQLTIQARLDVLLTRDADGGYQVH